MSDPTRSQLSDALHGAIADVYAQVRAPTWAASNADALLDVLRDLSWLPDGPVTVRVPARAGLPDPEMCRLVQVLMTAEAETAHAARPVRVIVG